MDERIHLLDFFLLDEPERIEVFDFTGYAHRKRRNIEASDRPDCATASQQIRPYFFLSVARAADQAHPCDYDTTVQSFNLQDDWLPAPRLLRVLFDVIDCIAHALNLFGVLVRNLDVEFLFKPHHQLDSIERVGAEIVDEPRVRSHFAFVHAEFIDDDLFDPFLNRTFSHFVAPPKIWTTNFGLSQCRTAIGASVRTNRSLSDIAAIFNDDYER